MNPEEETHQYYFDSADGNNMTVTAFRNAMGELIYSWDSTGATKVVPEDEKNPQRGPRIIDDVDGGEAKRSLIQELWNAGIKKELSPYQMAEIVLDEGWVPGEDLDRAQAELAAARREIRALQDNVISLEEELNAKERRVQEIRNNLHASQKAEATAEYNRDISEQLMSMPASEAYRQITAMVERFKKAGLV